MHKNVDTILQGNEFNASPIIKAKKTYYTAVSQSHNSRKCFGYILCLCVHAIIPPQKQTLQPKCWVRHPKANKAFFLTNQWPLAKSEGLEKTKICQNLSERSKWKTKKRLQTTRNIVTELWPKIWLTSSGQRATAGCAAWLSNLLLLFVSPIVKVYTSISLANDHATNDWLERHRERSPGHIMGLYVIMTNVWR